MNYNGIYRPINLRLLTRIDIRVKLFERKKFVEKWIFFFCESVEIRAKWGTESWPFMEVINKSASTLQLLSIIIQDFPRNEYTLSNTYVSYGCSLIFSSFTRFQPLLHLAKKSISRLSLYSRLLANPDKRRVTETWKRLGRRRRERRRLCSHASLSSNLVFFLVPNDCASLLIKPAIPNRGSRFVETRERHIADRILNRSQLSRRPPFCAAFN